MSAKRVYKTPCIVNTEIEKISKEKYTTSCLHLNGLRFNYIISPCT